MTDIKLFRFEGDKSVEVPGHAAQLEKSLQKLFESNLEMLLGVRFLATEYSTGAVHGGRIDTLGLDEDNCPVIIEYKRAVNENVINQGLFYLDWLMDHKADFRWLVLERFGVGVANAVDWTAPRLLCIAGNFTRYDEHAVKQIKKNIELLRYRRFGGDLLMIEMIYTPKLAQASDSSMSPANSSADKINLPQPGLPSGLPIASENNPAFDPKASQHIAYRISNAPQAVRDLYETTREYLMNLGDDVQFKELKYYVAFKRIKNFACIEVSPQKKEVIIYLKVDPDTVTLEPEFTRDVRKIGHYGTGDLEVSMRNPNDFEKAQLLIQRAYEEA